MAATNKRGVFSLEKVLERQVDNNWTDILDPFIYVTSVNPEQVAGPAHGYFAAGYNSGGYYYMSITQRLDYDNDTSQTVTKGNLPLEINECHGGTGNSSYGYTFGGRGPSPSNNMLSSTYRVEYANDTALASEKGSLSSGRRFNSSVGNANYGYAGGGYNTNYSAMDKLDYSNDTTATTNSDGLNPGRSSYACTGNQNYGYFIGGYGVPGGPDQGEKSYVSRLDYSNDSAATSPKGSLPNSAFKSSGTGNADYGYTGRGGGDNYSSRIYRIDYSNDTANPVQKGPLNYPAQTRVATGNGTTGYFAGGFSPSGTGLANNSGIDYSNDTATASPKGALVIGCSYGFNFSPREYGLPQTSSERSITPATRTETYPAGGAGTNYGYIASGDPSSQGGTNIYRIDFDADTTTASPKGKLNVVRRSNSEGSVGNASYGYFCGGFDPSHLSSIDRMDYGNDTATATPKGNLAHQGNNWAAAGNLNYGWIAAGQSPSTNYMTSINRIDYSSDTGTTVRGNTDNYLKISTAGNNDYGYWAGGQPSTSRTVRLDYSNDTTWGTTKGPLNASKYDVMGAGNANYGYFAGGGTGVPINDPSVVERLDYANDTATMSLRGPLSGTRMKDDAATANGSHGYFAPGGPGLPNKQSIDRVDFSNDTVTASPRGNILTDCDGRYGISPRENGLPYPTTKTVDKGAAGYTNPGPLGPAYGYATAGFPTANNTSVDRIDFSNDTATASPRGTILLETRNFNSVEVSSVTHGYIGGGQSPQTSSVDRIDYANDTASATAVGKLPTTNRGASGASNTSYGWFGGGNDGSNYISTVSRIDFSNDSATTSVRGPLSTTHRASAATGNSNYGYYAGGYTPSQVSTVSRVDYGNDTATASTKGPLSATNYNFAATGNANYGYWIGGSPSKSSIERLDFASDTTTAVLKGPLPTQVWQAWATGDQSYGYSTGGYTGSDVSSVYRIDFSNDTADAVAKGNLSAARRYHSATGARKNALQGSSTFIPRVRWVDSALESSPSPGPDISPSAGYIMGGSGAGSPSYNAPAQKIDFSNDTATAVVKGAPSSSGNDAYYSTAVGNRDYGYMTGGRTFEEVHRLDYSNDSAQMLEKGRREPNSVLGYEECATGNLNYGWFNGGYANYSFPGPAAGCPGTYAPNLSHIYRIDYANDTNNPTLRAYNTVAAGRKGACGNNNYGYWIGGSTLCYHTTGNSTYVERTDYASDTTNSVAKGNTTVYLEASRGQGNKDFGYSLGMSYGRSFVQRIDYANDTNTATPKGNLAHNFKKHGSTGNQPFGYAAGGYGPAGNMSNVDRIDYSNDTATASPKGPLANAVQEMGGCSASENQLFTTGPEIPGLQAPVQPPFPFPVQLPAPPPPGPAYGYYGGGSDGSTNRSSVDRIDYSNDTATAATKGPLDATRYALAATGNGSYGYFAGGRNQGTKVDRFDYSNDTAEALDKGSLNTGRYRHGAVGNADFGYFGGGNTPGNSPTSTIDRIDYANDTATAAEKGPLSSPVYNVVDGTGNSNFGYLAPGGNSIVHRIDYSNDTATAGEKGPLSRNAVRVGATGNADFGYFAGGGPFGSEKTTVDRLDYASDTTTAAVKGPLAAARYWCPSTGSSSFGYVGGGAYPAKSFVDRIDYANDTATASPKGPLSRTNYGHGAASARANGLPN